jgi:hypothetical protein
MNLLTFDTENMVSTRKGDALISFSRAGLNTISKAGAERTKYEGGDMVAIHQDKDNPEDWYISLSEAGFPLRDDKGEGRLNFNSKTMADTILDALEINEDRASFFIAGQPTEIDEVNYWAILTAKPIIKKRKKKS